MSEIMVDLGIYTEKERKNKYRKEYRRISGILDECPELSRKMVENLLKEAAFLKVTLQETREILARDGVIEYYKNGENQWGIKKAAAVEVYDKAVNTYSKLVSQLEKMLPEKVKIPPGGDGFDDFVADRD